MSGSRVSDEELIKKAKATVFITMLWQSPLIFATTVIVQWCCWMIASQVISLPEYSVSVACVLYGMWFMTNILNSAIRAALTSPYVTASIHLLKVIERQEEIRKLPR